MANNKIMIINGPNLNLLGQREPEMYGSGTLLELEEMCKKEGGELGFDVTCYQSNEEGEIVGYIQEAMKGYAGIIINAGAYTHTSVAIRDALLGVNLPVIEVHISNIFKRESFRHNSFISDVAEGVICGLGSKGYSFALQALKNIL